MCGQVAAAIKQLCGRLEQAKDKGRQLTDKEQLVLRLNQQYPEDVGVLAVYFLNYIRLKPDQVRTALTVACTHGGVLLTGCYLAAAVPAELPLSVRDQHTGNKLCPLTPEPQTLDWLHQAGACSGQ